MKTYLLCLKEEFVRDAQIDVNYKESMEILCANGYSTDEEEDRIADYEDREWDDAEGKLILEEFECEEKEMENTLKKLMDKYNLSVKDGVVIYEISKKIEF